MNLEEAVKLKWFAIEKETEKAYFATLGDPSISSHWIPKSQCRIVRDELYISDWFAEQLRKEGARI